LTNVLLDGDTLTDWDLSDDFSDDFNWDSLDDLDFPDLGDFLDDGLGDNFLNGNLFDDLNDDLVDLLNWNFDDSLDNLLNSVRTINVFDDFNWLFDDLLDNLFNLDVNIDDSLEGDLLDSFKWHFLFNVDCDLLDGDSNLDHGLLFRNVLSTFELLLMLNWVMDHINDLRFSLVDFSADVGLCASCTGCATDVALTSVVLILSATTLHLLVGSGADILRLLLVSTMGWHCLTVRLLSSYVVFGGGS